MSHQLATYALCTMIALSAAPVFGQKQPAKLVLLDLTAGRVRPGHRIR